MSKGASVKIGLAQVNNSFSGQHYLPYSVGLLQAYAQKYCENAKYLQFLPLIYKRLPVSEMIAALDSADIVGFSCYVWNHELSLETARRLKELNPKIIIVFGGPHVPDHCDNYLKKHPFIDIAVHGEGEQTFAELLDILSETKPNLEAVTGISYLKENGCFCHTGRRKRLGSLDEIPSPFLSGIFDKIMEGEQDAAWIGLWETNRGCPFQCTFCDWGSATAAKVTRFELDRLFREAEWFSSRKIEFIFCCDANFGILPRDIDIVKKVAAEKDKTGYPKALSVQNTKNVAERAYQVQKALSDAGLNKGVALSMQSLDGATLKNIKRSNISLEAYFDLMGRFTSDGVETYSDLILALPGETYDSYVKGMNALIEAGQHNRIQFNNLSILPNAEMANPEYRRKHQIQTVESDIINIHGAKACQDGEVLEKQELIIGTATMPPKDWREVRAISWMAAFLYFDKLLQIPLLLATDLLKLPASRLFEAFLNAPPEEYPTIAGVAEFFREAAQDIQRGGPEYSYSEEWLGIYWPADEFVFLSLTKEKKMDAFFEEAASLLFSITNDADAIPPLRDALSLNKALVKQPFVFEDKKIDLDHNIFSYYLDRRMGKQAKITQQKTVVEIGSGSNSWDDFNRWAKEIVWWGNKKGAYLYTNDSVEKQIAGIY